MTTAGLIGGLGPESTIDYYSRIVEAWQRDDPTSAPHLLIDSLDVQLGIHLVETDRAALIEYLLGSVQRLAAAGADFAAMCANTPHVVYDELATQAPIPLVSIVECCADEAQRLGLQRLGLLGTRFTMDGGFYHTVFVRRGIALVTPDPAERDWLHDRYMTEFLRGQFRDDVRERLVAVVARLRDAEGIDGVILGGTELPLLLTTARVADLPTLDTTGLHVTAIVRQLRAGTPPAGSA